MAVEVSKKTRRVIEGDLPFFRQDEQAEFNEFLNDLATILSTQSGKNVINTLIKECDIYSISKNYNNQMDAFKNGAKNIGLQLLHAVMSIDMGHTYTTLLSDYWKRYYRRTE